MNELKKRAKYHRKRQKGLSPFTTLSGDPKINATKFNSAMNTNNNSSVSAMSVGEALGVLKKID